MTLACQCFNGRMQVPGVLVGGLRFIEGLNEIANPQKLAMWLDLNGKRMQTGNTKTMIFDAATIVSYLSEFMLLEPGDLICSGTPPGVGMGKKPPRYLGVGDTVALGIEGLGEQAQTVIALEEATWI